MTAMTAMTAMSQSMGQSSAPPPRSPPPSSIANRTLNQTQPVDFSQMQVAETSVRLSEQLESAMKANAQLAHVSEKQTEALQELSDDKAQLVQQLEEQLTGLRQQQLGMAAQHQDAQNQLQQAHNQVQEVEKSCLWIQQQGQAEMEKASTDIADKHRKLAKALGESDALRTDVQKAHAEKAQSEQMHSSTINELLARIQNLEVLCSRDVVVM